MSTIDTKALKATKEVEASGDPKSLEYQAWIEKEVRAAQSEAQDPENLISHRGVRAALGLEY